jgi:hypothetical protein
MKKLSFALVLIAFALSGCGDKKLTLAEVRNPTSGTLGRMITTQGYFNSSSEQDLLSSDRTRFADMVDLSIFSGLAKEQRSAKRMDLGRRLEGKLVSVSGRLKVAPYGRGGRSTVFIEVESIDEVVSAEE